MPAPATPRTLFTVTETAHRNCSKCATLGLRARSTARVTGSVGATESYENRATGETHFATVRRVTR